MSDFERAASVRRWRQLTPAVRTAAVFALAAALALAVLVLAGPLLGAPPPGGSITGLVEGAWLALAVGWAGATVFALVHRRAVGRARRTAIDDPLRVEPLVAASDLGPRFDELGSGQAEPVSATAVPQPVAESVSGPVSATSDEHPADDLADHGLLAAPPPTPDARIDPDSTLAAPRWRPGVAVANDWDRSVQERVEGEPDHARSPDLAIKPGNAADQWDGPAAIPSAETPLPPLGEVAAARAPASDLDAVALEDERFGREDPVPNQVQEEAATLPTAEALLDRLATLAERERRARHTPRPVPNSAAERIADALAVLRATG